MDQVLPAMEKSRELLQENRNLLRENHALLRENHALLQENHTLLRENHTLLLENRSMLLAIIKHLDVPYKPPMGFNRGVPPKRPAPRPSSAVRESPLP